MVYIFYGLHLYKSLLINYLFENLAKKCKPSFVAFLGVSTVGRSGGGAAARCPIFTRETPGTKWNML